MPGSSPVLEGKGLQGCQGSQQSFLTGFCDHTRKISDMFLRVASMSLLGGIRRGKRGHSREGGGPLREEKDGMPLLPSSFIGNPGEVSRET